MAFWSQWQGTFFPTLLVQHGPTDVSHATLKQGRPVLAITRTTNMRGKWKWWWNAPPQIVIRSIKLKRKDPRHCKTVTLSLSEYIYIYVYIYIISIYTIYIYVHIYTYTYLYKLFISTYNDSSRFPLQQPTNSAYIFHHWRKLSSSSSVHRLDLWCTRRQWAPTHTITTPKTPKPQDAIIENQASTHHTQAISVASLPSMTLLHHVLKQSQTTWFVMPWFLHWNK